MERVPLARHVRGTLLAAAVAAAMLTGNLPQLFAQTQFAQTQPRGFRSQSQTFSTQQSTGFVNRVFRDAAGAHKYVVFVPANYSPDSRWPLILYLHGAAERGNDGVIQTTVGIGPFIRARAQTGSFPYIVVFPQCEDTRGPILTAWSATSADGIRALAILNEVKRDFSIDNKRCALTGWSMGGFGTWSLGAAHPELWSAVVPVSGGGDPASVAPLKNSAIWAFAGADDAIVRPQETTRMVDAVRAAGGHPRETIVPGVGHDVWKTVYNDSKLYDWLSGQSANESLWRHCT